jgi:GT2 family glycosyltransferase
MMVSRKVFDATGLFDKSMSAGNDMEILRRARAAGFSIWAVPSAETYHLVPEYRLRREYLRWVSLRWGSHFAEVDWKLLGGFRTSTLCVARVGHALLVRIPLLAIAYFAKREATFTDYQFLLWRAWGYARRCLYLTNPTIFAQPGFLKFLHFGVQEKFQNQPRRVLP